MKTILILAILCSFAASSCAEFLGYNDRRPVAQRPVVTDYCYTTWTEARCFNTYERCAIEEQRHFLDSVTPCRTVQH